MAADKASGITESGSFISGRTQEPSSTLSLRCSPKACTASAVPNVQDEHSEEAQDKHTLERVSVPRGSEAKMKFAIPKFQKLRDQSSVKQTSHSIHNPLPLVENSHTFI